MQTSVHPVSYDSQSFLKIDFPKYEHKFSIQESVCIKSKQSSNVSCDVCETKPFFAPVFSNCLYKDDTTIQSCNIFLDGDGGAGGGEWGSDCYLCGF